MNELNPTLAEALADDPVMQAAYAETQRLIMVVSRDLALPDVSRDSISDAINRLIRLNYVIFLIEGKQRDSVIGFNKALQEELWTQNQN